MTQHLVSQFQSRVTRVASAAAVIWFVGFATVPAAQAGRRAFFFDMGTEASPVRPGWTQVTHLTVYAAERGFGWERAAQASSDDPVGVKESFKPTHPHWAGPIHNDVLRDGVEDSKPLTFLADVPPGLYWVSVTMGRYTQARHDLNVTLNDASLATNLDAWGYVWGIARRGSHTYRDGGRGLEGRTFASHVRLCRGQAGPLERVCLQGARRGASLVSGREQELRVLGIRIQPWVRPRLTLRPSGGTGTAFDCIMGNLQTPGLQRSVTEFNSGRVSDAVTAARAFKPSSLDEFVEHGSLLDVLAGSMSVEDRETELGLTRAAEGAWREVLERVPAATRETDDRFWLAAWRAESAQRHRMAIEYVGMLAYGWAFQRTGLRSYDRYWHAFDLDGSLIPEDPLHWKGRLMRGRVAHWCWAEGHWKNAADLAAKEFAALKDVYPAHPVVRLYTVQSVPSRFAYRCPAPEAPEWARLQHEALARYLDLIHYWVERRQVENGELGGGWGDDVEILRGWLPAVLALDDPMVRLGLQRMSEGLWHSGDVTNGFSREVQDVEHGAEPVSDTQPLMCLVNYGNPVYLERCFETMACMRDVWTAMNARGHRHFKSHHFSSTEVLTQPPNAVDVALNGRAANPGLLPLWYSRHPGVQSLLGEWVRAWIEDAMSNANDKPSGFVPGSIRFADEHFGGFADHWWQTRDYFSDFESVDYTATLYNHMLGLFAATRDDFWMSCLQATVGAIQAEQTQSSPQAPVGSAAWAARLCDTESVAEVMAKWRLLTGRRDFDPFLARRGSPYQRYLLSGSLEALNADLRNIITALSTNIEMSTSEVLFTDRVALPGNEVLFEMMSGSLGVATYWPMHAVTWEKTGGDVAALVNRASETELNVQLFSFADHNKAIDAYLWRLAPGEYSVQLRQGETVMHDASLTLRERGQRFALELPSWQPIRLRISQRTAAPARPALLPDLALGPDAIDALSPPVAGKAARLRLTVHNIGSAGVETVRGELFDGPTRVATVTWPALDAPLDFRPRLATTEVDWTPDSQGPHTLRLMVQGVGESSSANNEITKGIEAR